MFIIEDLKLNKFSVVSVPRPRDLYSRIGGRVPSNGASGFVADYGKNKLEILSSDAADINDYQSELDRRKVPLAETLQ